MTKLVILSLLFYFSQDSIGQTIQNKVPTLNFNKFEPYLHRTTDTLYIVNFWASWCVPCREELPAFEKIGDKYSKMKVKVLLVSLDFPNQLETRLLPFIKKYKLKSEV